jgi:uncharacterized protein YceK
MLDGAERIRSDASAFVKEWRRSAMLLVATFFLASVSGCGTMIDTQVNVRSRGAQDHQNSLFDVGFVDFRVYGGTRADVEAFIAGEGPWDEELTATQAPDEATPRWIMRIYAFLDTPLSIGFDTVLLPFIAVWWALQ